MQRLKDKIEKRLQNISLLENMTYKGFTTLKKKLYLNDTMGVGGRYCYDTILSINDLCSPECSFLESLDRVKDNSITITVFRPKFSSEISYQAKPVSEHRKKLANLSDEDKILYILENTK